MNDERVETSRSFTLPDRRSPDLLAIKGLVSGDHSPGGIDAFLKGRPVPIVEGNWVTFLFRGGADAVNLKSWVYGLPTSQALSRIPDSDLWYLSLDLPARSRVEYKLEIVRGGNGEWIQDPLNPMQARDPFGANSVCHCWGYEVPEWTQPDSEARRGTVEKRGIHSTVFGGSRAYSIYLPARFRLSRKYPLLLVHDGRDYLQYANMQVVLDNLIHRMEIPEMVVALLDSPDRLKEYADDPRHATFLRDELVPHLEGTLPLIGRPDARCVMGASFGGVAALAAACHSPGFYGRLLLQSGSFAFSDIGSKSTRGPLFEPVVAFMNRFRSHPTAVSERVFVSCGMHESLIYENRSLVPMLQATGMELRYVEARDGHNWENWRDRLREGLSWLFPGPLWLVYE